MIWFCDEMYVNWNSKVLTRKSRELTWSQREAGQREHLGETLRDLHASETKQKMDIVRSLAQEYVVGRLPF